MSLATAFVEAPAYEDLIARGHALVPDFADRAARCESACRVSDEAVEQFRETGLHKTLLPAAYGGYEMGFSALLETSFSIGKVCASSAWVCGLYMGHNWLIRLLSRRTQSFIANEAKTATDLIFDAAGGRCLQHSHPLQRAWRDVAAINHHISLNFDAVMSMYGQFVFGLPLEGQY